MSDLYIRWAIDSDIRQILDIEQRSFEFPWSIADVYDHMRRTSSVVMVITPVDDNALVLGHMVYELKPTSLELLNLAVSPECRRGGVGSTMVRRLIQNVSYVHGKRDRITVLVRDSNLSAQCFFRAMGFKAIFVLRDAYEDCQDDGYVFQYRSRVPQGVRACS